MDWIAALILPLTVLSVALYAAGKKIDVFSALVSGAGEGLKIVVKMLPALVMLLSAVYMLRASGLLSALAGLLAPLFSLFGIPPETAPLIFIRPVSGSGALAVGSELISSFGPDSPIGRTAAAMLGSTETTFYVIAVYFGAAGIKKTRYAVFAALIADFVGFIAAAFFVRLFFS